MEVARTRVLAVTVVRSKLAGGLEIELKEPTDEFVLWFPPCYCLGWANCGEQIGELPWYYSVWVT